MLIVPLTSFATVDLAPPLGEPVDFPDPVACDLVSAGYATFHDAPETDLDPAEVPDDVVPGTTPGWPVNARTGLPLNLTDEQRDMLIAAKLEAAAAHDPLAALDTAALKQLAAVLDLGVPARAGRAKHLDALHAADPAAVRAALDDLEATS